MADRLDKQGILTALTAAERQITEFFAALSAEELALRSGTAWTPIEQLEHIDSAVKAVANGFAAPKLVLRLRFGGVDGPGRTYLELRDAYRQRLDAGGRAPAPFVPKPVDATAPPIETRRDDLLARWRRHNARLRESVSSWSEHQLDTIGLPHPILGTISAREMLFFTIYHSEHHLVPTRRRLPRFAAEA